MNFPSEIRPANGTVSRAPHGGTLGEVDATLRMIAKAPVPPGLEDRVVAGVLAAPRTGRVLAWPHPRRVGNWMRNTAAAAIVLAVGGGGWGIYSHVQPKEQTGAIAAPRVVVQPGAFSSAGVIRRPQTVNGPVLDKKTSDKRAQVQSTQHKKVSKSPATSKVVKGQNTAARQ